MAQTAALRDDFRKEGYSKEEEYFYRLNRELIEQRQQEREARRADQRQRFQDQPHWLRCAKCGTRMETENVFSIQVERCPSCHGIYLDAGELETLMQAQEPQTFLKRLSRVFQPREHSPKLF